tara:strand:- start:42105 stop:42263 length:159 start_codon:yes stop_codon:yes gene_type:complete
MEQLPIVKIVIEPVPQEPVDPHAGKKSEVMKPVVKAATGEKTVTLHDILGGH